MEFVELIPLGTTISENATIITAKFRGDYSGGIAIQAYWEGGTVRGAIATNLNPQVEIPNNYGSLSERKITFKYHLDGDIGPLEIETDTIIQSGATITASIKPDGNIPVEGGEYLCFLSGLYTGEVDVRCVIAEGKEGAKPQVISVTGKAGEVKTLQIPTNATGKLLNVTFEYSEKGKNDWKLMTTRIQDAKSKVEHDGEITVGGFEDQVEHDKEVTVD